MTTPIRVILSAVLPQEGGSITYKLTKEQAEKWLAKGPFVNYVQHDTVRAIGVSPAETRDTCTAYNEALIIKPRGRLQGGHEHSLDEIESIGYDIYLVIQFDMVCWGYEGYADATAIVPQSWGSSTYWSMGPGERTLNDYLES